MFLVVLGFAFVVLGVVCCFLAVFWACFRCFVSFRVFYRISKKSQILGDFGACFVLVFLLFSCEVLKIKRQ